jgi:hypothetical protein
LTGAGLELLDGDVPLLLLEPVADHEH